MKPYEERQIRTVGVGEVFDLSRRQRFVVAVLLVGFGIGGVVLAARRLSGGDVVIAPGPSPAGSERAEAAEREEAVKSSSAEIDVTVHVCGAVVHPGVYTLPTGSRVADAVRLAGGLAPGACPELVNMAQVLSDSAQVYIPAKPAQAPGAGQGGAAAGASRIAQGPAGADKTPPPGEVTSSSLPAGGMRVNINTAGLAELDTLPGIGPALAQRIVEHRAAIGRFDRPEQLMDVPGVGPRKYEALKHLVVVY